MSDLPPKSNDSSRELTETRLIDAICSAFESAWRLGEPTRIEDYLEQSSNAIRPRLFQSLLRTEFAIKQENGEQIEPDEYTHRFSEYSHLIDGLLSELTQDTLILDESRSVAHSDSTLIQPGSCTDDTARNGSTAGSRSSMHVGRPFGDNYQLIDELGRGGMGVVYKAQQLRPERVVALKMIKSGLQADSEELQRFRAEADAAGRLDHPFIVPIFEIGEMEGQHYLAMGFVEGEALDHRLRNQGPVPPREAAQLMQQVAVAVAYAHERGVIHRDLKPANILVDKTGKPRVADFGLAKRMEADSNLSVTGEIIGTPSYMPPEQVHGDHDALSPQTDVYSLGATLYCLLTGQPPFRAATLQATLMQVLEQEPPAPRLLEPSIDRDLQTICLKCLEKNPEQRISSADELANELGRYLQGEPVESRPVGRLERTWRWCRRKPAIAALYVTVVLILAAIGVSFGLGQRINQHKRLAELSRKFDAGLGQPTLNQDYLDRMDELIAEISSHDATRKMPLQHRLHEAFTAPIDDILRQPRLGDSDQHRVRQALSLLADRDAALADDLLKRLKERVEDWQQQFVLRAPFADLETVFDRQRVGPEEGQLVAITDTNATPENKPAQQDSSRNVIPTKIESGSDVRLEAEFDKSWLLSTNVGLALTFGNGESYEFLLSAPELPKLATDTNSSNLHPKRSFSTAQYFEQDLRIEIRKNGIPIQSSLLPAATIPEGSLQLFAERLGDRLTFQVNNLTPIEFQDIFPLQYAPTGKIAVVWPPSVRLTSLVAYRRKQAATPSPLQQADRQFAAGDFQGALTSYQQSQLQSSTTEIVQEAKFKEALCFSRLNRTDEANSLFERLMSENGDKWPILAGCHLWAAKLRKLQFDEADAVYAILSTQYSFEQLAVLVPIELRHDVMNAYIAECSDTLYILRHPADHVEHMKRAVEVDRYLSDDGNGQSLMVLRLIKAYGWNDQFEEALRTAKEASTKFEDDYIITQEYSRYLRRCNHNQEALRVISKAITSIESQIPTFSAQDFFIWCNLICYRARAYASLGDYRRAKDDLARVQQSPHFAKSRSPYFVGMTSLLYGLALEETGSRSDALVVWRTGFSQVRENISDYASYSLFTAQILLQLGSLSESITDEETNHLLAKFLQSRGNGFFAASFQAVSPKSAVASLKIFAKNARGRQYIRDFAWDQISKSHTRITQFANVGLFTFFLHNAFHGHLAPAQDEFLWQACEEFVDSILLRDDLNSVQLTQLALTWKGNTGLLGWRGVERSLPAQIKSATAYILAHRYRRLGNPQQADQFLKTAIGESTADSDLHKIATSALSFFQSGKGRLWINTDSEKSVGIDIKQGETTVASLDVERAESIDLPPGDYEIALRPMNDQTVLSHPTVRLKAASVVVVNANSAVKSSPTSGDD